jgi:hypothetical protein
MKAADKRWIAENAISTKVFSLNKDTTEKSRFWSVTTDAPMQYVEYTFVDLMRSNGAQASFLWPVITHSLFLALAIPKFSPSNKQHSKLFKNFTSRGLFLLEFANIKRERVNDLMRKMGRPENEPISNIEVESCNENEEMLRNARECGLEGISGNLNITLKAVLKVSRISHNKAFKAKRSQEEFDDLVFGKDVTDNQRLESCLMLLKVMGQATLIDLIYNRDLRRNTETKLNGSPDTLTWTNESYCFYEVKTPNDSIQASQKEYFNAVLKPSNANFGIALVEPA